MDVQLLLHWLQCKLLLYWTWKRGIRKEVVNPGINFIEFSIQDPALLDLCAWRCQQEQIGHAWKIPL